MNDNPHLKKASPETNGARLFPFTPSLPTLTWQYPLNKFTIQSAKRLSDF